jgi:2-polyprenyl-6-methoxyphenol hydroxylase-like FAD-dependent oxidoreductase
MVSGSQKRPLKVLIVGGGIAGLTLANALEKLPLHIEYILLESKDHLAPQLGAGLALLPNGSRILDQLGLYDSLNTTPKAVMSSGLLDAYGRPLISERTDTAQLIAARMSYPFAWVERRILVQVLAAGLKRRGCIVTSKKVAAIEYSEEEGTAVLCTDGSIYYGDTIIGADGIHSKIRHEMWRYIDKHGGEIDVTKERRSK